MQFLTKKAPGNFYQAFSPIYYIFKFFGLFPFSFKGPIKLGKLQFNAFDLFWSILVMILHWFLLAYLLYVMSLGPFEWMHSKILDIGYKAITIIGIISYFLIYIDQLINRKKIQIFFDVLRRFDEQVCDIFF